MIPTENDGIAREPDGGPKARIALEIQRRALARYTDEGGYREAGRLDAPDTNFKWI